MLRLQEPEARAGTVPSAVRRLQRKSELRLSPPGRFKHADEKIAS